MSYAAQAEGLAADAAEIGAGCAAVVAGCRAARVAPEATRSVVTAALILHAPHLDLYAAAEPVPTDEALLTAAADLEASASDLLRDARRLRDQAAEARRAATAAATAASREEAQSGTTEATQTAISTAVSQAADCDAALEILDDVGRRLHHAAERLGHVPDDLETAYEVPYAHVRSGRVLPHSGDFLTPASMEGAA